MSMNMAGKIPAFKERFQPIVDGFGGITRFAEKFGGSRQSVGFWYNGDRAPDAENLIMLSQFLNVSIDYLLGISDTKNPINIHKTLENALDRELLFAKNRVLNELCRSETGQPPQSEG